MQIHEAQPNPKQKSKTSKNGQPAMHKCIILVSETTQTGVKTPTKKKIFFMVGYFSKVSLFYFFKFLILFNY